jgi:hypothetical protein
MAWAIEQQEIIDPHARFVLVGLANWAGATGQNAFPSIARLCRDTGLSESTVRRSIQNLERASLIMKGNQAIAAAHISRVDKRPVVYDLLMSRGVSLPPRSASEVANEKPPGVKDVGAGCQALTPDPKKSDRKPKMVKIDFREDFKQRFGRYPDDPKS